MDMNHVGAKLVQNGGDPPAHIRRSGKLAHRNRNFGQLSMNRIVIGVKSPHLDAVRSQQAGLCVHHGVFSAALLIPVVDQKDFHALPDSS
jgi:hypothetical protein